jgi:hypothetical protein
MLTHAQERKLATVPAHLRGMYREAVEGSRKAALRLHCLECVAWVPSEVEACSAPGCVLFPYRLTGTHPATAAAARDRAIAAGCADALRGGSTTDETVAESPLTSPGKEPYPGAERAESDPEGPVA